MIAIIVAMSENRVIGREGKIPWDLPEDRKKFQMLTMGNAIVMGRRTYDEIGHPLPGRMTYLLSGTKKVELENCHTVQSLEEVWEKCPEILNETMHSRFRSENDVNQWLFRYWQLCKGNFSPVNPKKDRKYFELDMNIDEICSSIKNQKKMMR